jgi:hypothetical protein
MSGSNFSADQGHSMMSETSSKAVPSDEPLALTVHSLPEPRDVMCAESGQSVWRGRVRMLLVLLICAAPVIASYFTYYVIRPEGRRHFGELIEPQRTVPAQLTGHDLDGVPVLLSALRGQWLLLTVASGECDGVCEKQLYLQRQLRESLGKERERVDKVWLVTGQAAIKAELLSVLPGTTVLRLPDRAIDTWLFPAQGHRLDDHLYLVDPMGNWMMRFPAHMDLAQAAQAKRDIERVLRASASWDTPGR